MSENSSTEPSLQSVRRAFFIPDTGDLGLNRIKKLKPNLSGTFIDLAEAFESSLLSSLWTAAAPGFVAWGGALREMRTKLEISALAKRQAEKLEAQALKMEENPGAPIPSWPKTEISEVREDVDTELSKRSALVSDISLHFLRTTFFETRHGLKRVPVELLRQCTVLLWNALEVLATDVLVALVNKAPMLLGSLLADESAKKLFQQKGVDVETLIAYNFQVSNSLGEIFFRDVSTDSVVRMKTMFSAVFPDDKSVKVALSSELLWRLNHQRNLIVHRRGIVDSHYLKMSGETLELGTELVIPPEVFKQYADTIEIAGCEILCSADRLVQEAK